MKYWLNLFTFNTWQEFKEAGGAVSGFRERRWRTLEKMTPGDVMICYMTGLSRFFAILEVTGNPYRDETPIWSEAMFSARIPVKIILELPPENAVPVVDLRDHLSYFQHMTSPHAWTGHFRSSPLEERLEDARVVISALYDAAENPVARPYDERDLKRKVPVFSSSDGLVSIPESNDEPISSPGSPSIESDERDTTHDEIQWLLLHLGSKMNLDVWVASNDKSKGFKGRYFKDLPRLLEALPVQFNEATNRTIELIDVLWLKKNTIIAAFEIEHTTSVYSGLLRLADLVAMQPNLNIPLYIVAPDVREDKVRREINRPIFAQALKQPLSRICRFIPYSSLKSTFENQRDFIAYLRPEFLDKIAKNMELENI